MQLYLRDYINDKKILKKVQVNETISFFKSLSKHIDSEFILHKEEVYLYTMSITNIILDKWKIDYPIKYREVHKQCYATKEQCIAIIEELYEKGHIDDVPGFIEVPIREYTLDEMLEIKKEEEMMLRGENPHSSIDVSPSINEYSTNTGEIKPPIQSEKITQAVEQEIKKTIQKKPINKDTLDSLFEI